MLYRPVYKADVAVKAISIIKRSYMDIEEAKNNALTFVKNMFSHLSEDDYEKLVIDDEVTEEFPWGWAFSVQTKKFLETKDFLDACVGFGQIIVDKIKNKIKMGPSSDPDFVSKYNERYGLPNADGLIRKKIVRIIFLGWNEGLEKVTLIRLLKSMLGKGLKESKENVDDLLEGKEIIFEIEDEDLAYDFAQQAEDLGVKCRIEQIVHYL